MKNELKSFTAKCLVLVNSLKFFILGGGRYPRNVWVGVWDMVLATLALFQN